MARGSAVASDCVDWCCRVARAQQTSQYSLTRSLDSRLVSLPRPYSLNPLGRGSGRLSLSSCYRRHPRQEICSTSPPDLQRLSDRSSRVLQPSALPRLRTSLLSLQIHPPRLSGTAGALSLLLESGPFVTSICFRSFLHLSPCKQSTHRPHSSNLPKPRTAFNRSARLRSFWTTNWTTNQPSSESICTLCHQRQVFRLSTPRSFRRRLA